MPQMVQDPSLVGPFGGSMSHACLQSDLGSSATSSTTSSSTATAVAAATFAFAVTLVAFAAVLVFAADLLSVLPEVDVDFFVANGRSSQLIYPP